MALVSLLPLIFNFITLVPPFLSLIYNVLTPDFAENLPGTNAAPCRPQTSAIERERRRGEGGVAGTKSTASWQKPAEVSLRPLEDKQESFTGVVAEISQEKPPGPDLKLKITTVLHSTG